MTARFCFYLLILLIMTLISLQNPLPALNSDVSLTKYPYFQASKYKEKEGRIRNTAFKRQAVDGSVENQNNKLLATDILKRYSKDVNDRNKRFLEESSVVDRDQYYKPLGEEIKQAPPVGNPDKVKEVKQSQKPTNYQPGPAKSSNPLKTKQLRRAVDNSANNISAQSERSGNGLEDLSGRLVNGEYEQSINRIKRQSYAFDDVVDLSAGALETLKKMNPLTIGDQVSKMIHDRKCDHKKKCCKTNLRSSSSSLHKEDKVGLHQEIDDTSRLSPISNVHPTPASAQKTPSSRDYGFSVIILAGDPIKIPEEEKDKKNNEMNTGYSDNGRQWVDDSQSNYDNLNRLDSINENDELPIEKAAKAPFPVYDEDFNSNPDPLNGLYDPKYWDALDKIDPEWNPQPIPKPIPKHKINTRSTLKKSKKSGVNENTNKTKDKKKIKGGSNEDASVDEDENNDVAGVETGISVKNVQNKVNGNSKKDEIADGEANDVAGIDSSENKNDGTGENNGAGDKADNDVTDEESAKDDRSDNASDEANNVEPFGDLSPNKSDSCCISWNDMTVYCGKEENTTEDEVVANAECSEDSQGGKDEEFGDMDIGLNKTCCKSWKEPSLHGSPLKMPQDSVQLPEKDS